MGIGDWGLRRVGIKGILIAKISTEVAVNHLRMFLMMALPQMKKVLTINYAKFEPKDDGIGVLNRIKLVL